MSLRGKSPAHLWRCPIDTPWVRSWGPPPPLLITCCSCWRYTMSAPKRLFKCCVLGCIGHRSLHRLPPSEPRTLWLNLILLGNVLEKKLVNSPILVGINTNASCTNVNSRQSKYHAFVFQNCPSERAYWHSVRLMMLKLPLCLSIFNGPTFCVIHKRRFIMHSTIRWQALKQSMLSVKITGLY